MENQKIFIIIGITVCILFAISSVNAGIFEFAEDTGDDADIAVDDIKDDNFEIKEFKIKVSNPKQVKDMISDIQDDSYNDNLETVVWLMDFEGHKLFTTDDGDFLVVDNSESGKIPTSNEYSYCIVECKVVETNHGNSADYHLVKDINVTKKVKNETAYTSSSNDSSSSSSKSSSSSQSTSSSSVSSSSSGSNSYPYIGNAATYKFHSHSCHDVGKMLQSNMVFFSSREDAINHDYVPCGHCHP